MNLCGKFSKFRFSLVKSCLSLKAISWVILFNQQSVKWGYSCSFDIRVNNTELEMLTHIAPNSHFLTSIFFFLYSWWILPCLNKELFYSILFQYIEDIAWSRGDTKFLFECWKIFHEWAQRGSEIFFQHEKINFVSPSDHVLFYLLYKHQWNTKPFYLNSFLVWKVRFIMKP